MSTEQNKSFIDIFKEAAGEHCEAILYGLEEGIQVRLINLVYNHRICPN